MDLNEKLARVKKLMNITEGYREVDEIAQLADQAIKIFAMRNTDVVVDAYVNGNHNINFRTNYLTLKRIADGTDYDIIQNFIDKSSVFIKFGNMKGYGSYNTNINTIEINLSVNNFVPKLEDSFDDYELEGTKKVLDFKLPILIDAMNFAFRTVIIHELQHAYDSFVSNDKYITDDKSQRYYQRKSDSNVKKNYKLSREEFNIYNSLPHEYWARFSETISSIDFSGNKTMNEIIPEFQKKFRAWMNMSPSTKERLYKALYKYFDNKRNPKKPAETGGDEEKIVYTI